MDAYIYNADIYCEHCAAKIMAECRAERGDPEGREADGDDSCEFPQGPYSQGGGEADCPQHCGGCGVFLGNPLTDDGWMYLLDKLADGTGDAAVLREWGNHYGISIRRLG